MAPKAPQGGVGIVPWIGQPRVPRRGKEAIAYQHVRRRAELWRQGRSERRKASRRQSRVGKQPRERGGCQDARDSSCVDDALAADGGGADRDGSDGGSDPGERFAAWGRI